MSDNIGITEAEWNIMEILWKNKGMTMNEIRGALKGSNWSDSTVKTLVSRLVKKGAVISEERARNSRYTAAVRESECRRRETENLINRVYNGSVKMMVSNLVEGSGLSDEEVRELMDIIDKMEG